jgi:AcrR family transcriptional regulator
MGLSPEQITRSAHVRQTLIQAAGLIILRSGIHAMTLDAVAKEAGTSKGGLLHHFRSKSELLNALLDELLARFEQSLSRFAEDDPEPAGRYTRAYIRASLETTPEENQFGIALIAALLHDPDLIQRWREATRTWIERDLSEADPVQSLLLRLAADGVWLTDTFRLHPLDPGMRTKVIQRLLMMTRA